MKIKNIELINFRNYEKEQITLNPKINIFHGDNAQGKTNILESIFLCSIGKSFRTNKEKELIQFNKEFTSIIIEYEKKDREGKIKYDISDKKNIAINGIKIKKLSELLGNIHTVIFTPDDIHILKNGPAARRKFLDMFIGQLRPNYIYYINLYLKTLEQRNNYIKQIKFENKKEELLEIWDEKLNEYAIRIYEYRKEFIQKLIPKINAIHRGITEGKEEIDMQYQSDLENNFLKLLQKDRKLDIIRGYTGKGIHKDDFSITINGKLVNIYGSQGQHRTVMLSLKMAELEVIHDEIGEYPVLLLDDFMSELDEKRRKNFLQNIKNTQVIITCTEDIKIETLESTHFYVQKGKIQQEV